MFKELTANVPPESTIRPGRRDPRGNEGGGT